MKLDFKQQNEELLNLKETHEVRIKLWLYIYFSWPFVVFFIYINFCYHHQLQKYHTELLLR